jgi:hypothetical protein
MPPLWIGALLIAADAVVDPDLRIQDVLVTVATLLSAVDLDEQSDHKTVVTMRQLHRSKAQRDATIGFGAVELGYQTLDKLAEHLRAQR